MSRLPFDASKMAAARQAAAQAKARDAAAAVLTVSQLGEMIDGALKRGLPVSIQVTGEISGFTDRTHWYFDLKDAGAVVNCIIFQSAGRRVSFRPHNGQQVIAHGRIDFYAKGGRVSFVADKIELAGAGALEIQLKALVEEVRALGWLDPARKRRVPMFPRQVAVITSRSGAALQDVLVTMRRRCQAVAVLLVDVRVQGDHAAPDVAAALREISRRSSELKVDAVLVTRGGGSMEDLWPFNDREVARAIVECAIPVVAAIGHETDVTIAELVADQRCATPTQAAMCLTPDTAALLHQVDALHRRMTARLDRTLKLQRQRLASAARHPWLVDPRRLLQQHRNRLATATERLVSALKRALLDSAASFERLTARLERNRPAVLHTRTLQRLDRAQIGLAVAMRSRLEGIDIASTAGRLERAMLTCTRSKRIALEGLGRHLQSVSPTRVLERGYSLTFDANGHLIRSAAQVSAGEHIETRLRDGSIGSVVGGGSPAPLTTPPHPESAALTRRSRRAVARSDSPGLFGTSQP